MMDFNIFNLGIGQWKAHLFCCDGYTIYATVEFNVVEEKIVDTTSVSTNFLNKVGKKILIYPNPAKDWLYLKGLQPHRTYQMEILSLDGKVIREELLTEYQQPIFIGNLPEGFYSLVLKHQRGFFQSKIRIQK